MTPGDTADLKARARAALEQIDEDARRIAQDAGSLLCQNKPLAPDEQERVRVVLHRISFMRGQVQAVLDIVERFR